MVGGLFVWWFQLNGGPCGLGVRARNLGKPNRLGPYMIDSKGNVRPEGMFNRAYLAPEAQRAYDTLLERAQRAEGLRGFGACGYGYDQGARIALRFRM